MPDRIKLSPRLSSAVSLSKRVGVAWDVGTDHCFLPVYLIRNGLADFVVASDINDGPILVAKDNIKGFPDKDKILLIKRDGLDGAEEYSPEEVFICGMGGELIRDIIKDCPYLKESGARIIVQPMTKPEVLRNYLASDGFDIEEETLVKEDKIYEIFSATYSGNKRSLTPADALCGGKKVKCSPELEAEFLLKKAESLKKRKDGLDISGRDSSAESELINEIERRKAEINAKIV